MKKTCILCDFDGTITIKDALYYFFKTYCEDGWQEVESLWQNRKIGSKECLKKELALVQNLCPELINDYTKSVDIDESFIDFFNFTTENDIDLYIVSDGIDYFIEKILENHNIKGIKIISNHGEFKNDEFKLSYPNNGKNCVNNLGTCKCNVLSEMKTKYEKVIFVGDGVSDFCVANKADLLFAKKSLVNYCEENGIKYFKYNNFDDIKNKLFVKI